MYVPHTLIVPGNATATARNILASEMLFRAGMVCELINAVAFIFVVRALYRLLNGVNKAHASLMVTLYMVSVPILCLNVLNEVAALALFRGADFLSAFDKPQRDALPCCSSVCTARELISPRCFGVSGFSPSVSW
jgi:hypothetical protein